MNELQVSHLGLLPFHLSEKKLYSLHAHTALERGKIPTVYSRNASRRGRGGCSGRILSPTSPLALFPASHIEYR